MIKRTFIKIYLNVKYIIINLDTIVKNAGVVCAKTVQRTIYLNHVKFLILKEISIEILLFFDFINP